ncbi:ABC transporter permease [Bacillus alkalicellulosilyticus]|uniref:fluoroquinolone export ABC transporter permease subunit n=1 Tax=Alkalihalobacterium alkalicellulosilyticum TaxID=1912214 RepID=UPI00099727BD|nr:ABC transporter permease [Bacillus alkalicellulosilyticus]
MNSLMVMLRQDVKFQIRHGFYLVYAVITLMYIALLSFIPEKAKPMTTVIIVFSDPSALGYFFIGGIILLEKGQNIYDNLFVTPLQIRDYLLSKVVSLGLLSVLTASVIHIAIFGLYHITFLFILGVFLTSVFFTLIGIGVAVRCKSLNGFFLMSPFYALIFCVPIVGFVQLYDSPLYYLLPTQASLLLINSTFSPVGVGEMVLLLTSIVVWLGIAFLWAQHSFHTQVVLKVGG